MKIYLTAHMNKYGLSMNLNNNFVVGSNGLFGNVQRKVVKSIALIF
jgi:hypothetical protein